MTQAYDAFLLQLKRAGIVPKKHVLEDNEVSENTKNHICDTYNFDMELVPMGCHQCNAAKVAICRGSGPRDWCQFIFLGGRPNFLKPSKFKTTDRR
jgi:hypothetical protein